MLDYLAAHPLAVAITLLVLVLVAILAFIASRLRTVPPDEVLIVVSMGGSKARTGNALSDPSNHSIHTSGRVFVVPVIQDAFSLSLKQRQVEIAAVGPDRNFVPVSVEGNLSFKFSDRPEDVVKAAQRFRRHTDEQLSHSIQQAVEGSLRSIIASMTFSEINSDRQAFQQHVLESAKAELADQGIGVDVLNIRGISTPGSTYSEDLAKAELAAARRNADIAEAKAAQEAQFAKIQASEQVAERQRDLALKQADIKAQTERANAVAEAAAGLARAEQDANVAKADRAALTERALVEQERLDIDQKKPADAAAYATRVKAEGERDAANAKADAQAYERLKSAESESNAATLRADADKAVAQKRAEAEAYQRKTAATADAEAVKALADAESAAELVRGQAKAQVTQQLGQAEADATEKKAAALSSYGTDALVYELVARLPEIMKANADAVSGIGSYTVVGTEGASDAVAQATKMGAQTLGAIEGMTGIDLKRVLNKSLAKGEAPAPAAPAAEAPAAD